MPTIAWETIFNGCTHTQSSYTHREICNHVLEGKNSSKGLNFNKKWRKTSKGTHCSIFWRRQWKSTVRLSFKHIFINFNSCLCLTWFIVTKLIIYSFYHHNNENPKGNTPSHLPQRYWSEIRSRVRIWRAGQHTHHHEFPGIPPRFVS